MKKAEEMTIMMGMAAAEMNAADAAGTTDGKADRKKTTAETENTTKAAEPTAGKTNTTKAAEPAAGETNTIKTEAAGAKAAAAKPGRLVRNIRKLALAALAFICIFSCRLPVEAASNPYPKSYTDSSGIYHPGNCTWQAWQEAYNRLGIALPAWGNANSWYSRAQSAGYKVTPYVAGGRIPTNSIAVWAQPGHCHVAYVVSADANGWTLVDGNIKWGGSDYLERREAYYRYGSRTAGLTGFIELTSSSSVSASWSLWTEGIADTNAVPHAKVTASQRTTFTGAGIQLWNQNGSLIASKHENVSISGTYLNIWYDVKSELGKTLSPGSSYTYQIYADFGGKRYYSDKQSFKTTGTSTVNSAPASIRTSWSLWTEGIADTNAVPHAKITLSQRSTFTGAGIQLWSQSGTLIASKHESISINGTYLNIWYDVRSELGKTLTAGSTYTYQIYADFGGKRYYSAKQSFKTTGTAPVQKKVHMHSYSSWKTVRKATILTSGIKERTCSCGAKQREQIPSLKARIRLTRTSVTLKKSQSTKVGVLEITAGDRIVSWTSSNSKIASVNKNGIITGKKKGQAQITVKLASGLKASVKVTVK
ncbi:MAG: Ig-like domain-containing protein [Eubacterium sp.]|nr:Ig-like domain-containing protein [Eubacterium sp.]